jgi:hypothetical protein
LHSRGRLIQHCNLARLPTPSTTHAPPLRGPGPFRPLPGTKELRPANFRLGHRAPGRGGRRARTVSGCVNSAFLAISIHFTAHLFRPWIPSSARSLGKALPNPFRDRMDADVWSAFPKRTRARPVEMNQVM